MNLLAPFENLIGWLLAEIYAFVPNLGVAIILLTCLVMLIIFPLTHKQTKAMIATQALQPQLKALQAKHKDDRQKLSEETMALYKSSGVNPLGSCLPTLIQMPFLFSIYRVVRKIENYADPHNGLKPNAKLFNALCAPAKTLAVCHANAGGMIKAGFDPNKAEALAAKLPMGKNFLGLHLAKNLPSVANLGAMTITPYIIMIILLGIASYISISRQQKLNPNAPSQMKFLKYLFPLGIGVTGVLLPGGTNLYILMSTSWRACQQEFLYRKIILPHRAKQGGDIKATAKEIPSPPGTETQAEDPNYKPGLARQKRKKK